MDFYKQMATKLEAREQELARELEQVRAALAALQPLGNSHARGGATARTPGATVVQLDLTRATLPRTLAEAARRVLVNAGRPLHIRHLVDGIQIAGLMKGRTFEEVRASLTPTLLRRRDLFIKVGRGIYGLAQEQEKQG